MTATVTYIQPKLNTLLKNSFDVAPEVKPELTLLDQGQGKSTRYLYIYRVCYLDRHSLDPTIRSLNERKKVNISSLCSKRISLIQPILKGLLEGRTNIPDFSYMESIFDWIDREGRSADLYEVDGARRLYRDYTDLIRHRLRISSVGTTQAIGYPMAQSLQSAAAYICAQASGHDPKVVQSWAIRIPQKKMGLNELPAPATTSDEHALAYALHQRFFEAFSHAVLSNTAPPVVVNLADLGFDDLIFYSQIANNANGWSVRVKGGRTDWQPYFFRREGIFEGTASAFNKLLAEHGIPSIQDYNFKRLQDNNRRFHLSTLREMANHATRHFGHLLMSETGNNAAHCESLGLTIEAEDLDELRVFDAFRAWDDDPNFAVGKVWPLSSHQFRRSVAVYASRSGMVSLPTLKTQFKHLSAVMTALYSENSSYAQNFLIDENGNPLENGSILMSFRDAIAFNTSVRFHEQVIQSEKQLSGAIGTDIQRAINTNTLPKILQSREETQLAIKQGKFSFKETPVGGCVSKSSCPNFAIDLVLPCTSGCKHAILKPEKLEIYIESLRFDLGALSPKSRPHQLIAQEIDFIKATYLKSAETEQ